MNSADSYSIVATAMEPYEKLENISHVSGLLHLYRGQFNAKIDHFQAIHRKSERTFNKDGESGSREVDFVNLGKFDLLRQNVAS